MVIHLLIRSRRMWPLVFAVLSLVVSGVRAEALPLTLVEAEKLALGREPGISSATAKADALLDQAVSSQALPDPQLRLGLVNLPVGSYDFNQEPMTQKQIGFRQQFPAAGNRKAKRRRYEHQAEAMQWVAQARQREVIREVRSSWLELYYWQHAKRIVTKNRTLFTKLTNITHSLYSVGRQNQQDLVRAELELSRLDDRLLTIEDQLLNSQAALSQWLGNSIQYRQLADKLPEWHMDYKLGALEKCLISHPRLSILNAQIASEAANIDIARSHYKPGMALDLTYGQREDDLLGNSRDDFFSVMLTLDIPLFTGNRQDKQVSAATHQQSAKQHERELLLRQLQRQLESQYARWQQLQFRIELFDETIIEQSRIQAQATLQAYQSDTSDFDDVMRAAIADLNTQLDFIRLQIDHAKAYAALDYLAGFSEEGNQYAQ